MSRDQRRKLLLETVHPAIREWIEELQSQVKFYKQANKVLRATVPAAPKRSAPEHKFANLKNESSL